MNGFKYGLMAFEDLDGDASNFELAPGAWTFCGEARSLFRQEDIGHWREWVGTTEWRAFAERTTRLLVLRISSDRPEVLDAENQQLEHRLFQMRRALLLSGPNGLAHGKNWIATGEASGLAPRDSLKSIRQFGHGETLIRPYYAAPGHASFWDRRPAEFESGWLDRWRATTNLLELAADGGFPPLLGFGLLAFERAFESFEIEFKIPDCVRAAEAILGLPARGGGREEFGRRALALVPELRDDWYVGGEQVRDRLVNLYVHRNECVHGMVPFARQRDAGLDGLEEAAKFDYLAEFVARAVLLVALRHPRCREVFVSREVLEREWAEGRFP